MIVAGTGWSRSPEREEKHVEGVTAAAADQQRDVYAHVDERQFAVGETLVGKREKGGREHACDQRNGSQPCHQPHDQQGRTTRFDDYDQVERGDAADVQRVGKGVDNGIVVLDLPDYVCEHHGADEDA